MGVNGSHFTDEETEGQSCPVSRSSVISEEKTSLPNLPSAVAHPVPQHLWHKARFIF